MRLSLVSAVLVAILVCAPRTPALAQDPVPPPVVAPAGYETTSVPPPPPAQTASTYVAAPAPVVVEPEPNPTLFTLGKYGLYFTYGVSLGFTLMYLALIWPFQAAFSDDDAPSAFPMLLAVPIVGPIVAAHDHFAVENPGIRPLLYADSILQSAFLVSLLLSYAFKTQPENPATADEGPRFMLAGGPLGSFGLSIGVITD